MIRKISAVTCAAFLLLFMSLPSQAAESPSVVEAYGCSFVDGKDMDDLDDAIKYYASNRSKIDSAAVQKMRSRIWTPVRGRVPVDFVWFNSNLNFNEWGEASDAFISSPTGQDVQARFDQVALCNSSSVHTNEMLLNTPDRQFEDDGTVAIESYRCRLHPGQGMAASDKALKAWEPVFQKAVDATNSASFVARRTPIISGFDFDLSYLLVWDDLNAFAVGNSAYRADESSAEATRLFEVAHRCESALFFSRTVVQPAE